jgi:hypothetical protein
MESPYVREFKLSLYAEGHGHNEHSLQQTSLPDWKYGPSRAGLSSSVCRRYPCRRRGTVEIIVVASLVIFDDASRHAWSPCSTTENSRGRRIDQFYY